MLARVQREIDGRTYYEFEFATKANTYIRHALAVVTVGNGKLLVLPEIPHCADRQRLLTNLSWNAE